MADISVLGGCRHGPEIYAIDHRRRFNTLSMPEALTYIGSADDRRDRDKEFEVSLIEGAE